MHSRFSTLPLAQSQELDQSDNDLPDDALSDDARSVAPVSPFPLEELPNDMISEIVARLSVSDPVGVFKLYLAYLPSNAGSYCRNVDQAGRIERIIRPFLSPLALMQDKIEYIDGRTRLLNVAMFDINDPNEWLASYIPLKEIEKSLPHLWFIAKQLQSPVLLDCFNLLTDPHFKLKVDYQSLSTQQAIAWVNNDLVDFSRLDIQINEPMVDFLGNFAALQSSYPRSHVTSLQDALARTCLDSLKKLFSVGNTIDAAEKVYRLCFNHACFKKKERGFSSLISMYGMFSRRGGLSSNGDELSDSQKALQAGYLEMTRQAEEKQSRPQMKFTL